METMGPIADGDIPCWREERAKLARHDGQVPPHSSSQQRGAPRRPLQALTLPWTLEGRLVRTARAQAVRTRARRWKPAPEVDGGLESQ